mgnify:CR=1 FL=1
MFDKKAWRLAQREHENELARNKRKTSETARLRSNANVKKCRDKMKEKVFKLLGDKCVYCGCDNKQALEINHKNGGNGIRGEHGTAFWSKISTGERSIEDLEMTCRVCNIKYYLELQGEIGFEVIWYGKTER